MTNTMNTALFDTLPIGVMVLDADLHIRGWNRWLVEYTGIGPVLALGRTLNELFPGLRTPRFDTAVAETLRHGGPRILSQALHRHLIPVELPHLAQYGLALMRQHVHIESVRLDDETLAVVSIIDVTGSVLRTEALTDMAQRLENDVNRDPLTHLFNRRFMWEWLDHQHKQAQRYDYPIAAMMVDLDHFKEVNDRHGHAVGDQVLLDFACLLSGWVREADIVVRYGGEEFLILLPRCDQVLATDVAWRITRQTGETGLGGLPPDQVRCSIGVALFEPAHPQLPAELLHAADRRLYLAKCNGRNQVVADG